MNSEMEFDAYVPKNRHRQVLNFRRALAPGLIAVQHLRTGRERIPARGCEALAFLQIRRRPSVLDGQCKHFPHFNRTDMDAGMSGRDVCCFLLITGKN